MQNITKMTRPLFKLISVFAISCLLSCSSTMQFFSDRDKEVNLKNYKTYAWLAPDDTVYNSPREDLEFGEFIMKTSNLELKKKGMLIDTIQPDAVFMIETNVENKIKYTQSPTVSVGMGFGGPGYYGGVSAPVAGGDITGESYQEGTLIIYMYDIRTGNLIWHGYAVGALTLKTRLEPTIERAVHGIFGRLPIKHKK
jgi:hypothetical protein